MSSSTRRRTRARWLFFLASLAFLVPVASGTLSRALAQGAADRDSFYKQLSIFTEVLSLVRRAYVQETPIENLFAGALDGATDALDPFATYVPAGEVDSYFAAREVGASRSGLYLVRERGIVHVVAVAGGSPAAAAGLERGDILTRVGERSGRQAPLWELETLLAGEPGTEIEVEALRRGQAVEARLVLGPFAPPAPGLERRRDVGVLTVPHVDAGTVDRVVELLGDERARGRLIVDLRSAAGGDAAAAYRLAAAFARGDLGQIVQRGAGLETFRSDADVAWSGDVVVLINSGTQGAAEIVAAVLHQAAGARAVGQRTFGHAGRGDSRRLSNGDRVFLTDAFYTGPDGQPLSEPLVPDVVISEASRMLGEAEMPLDDLALERAIDLLLGDSPPVVEEEAA